MADKLPSDLENLHTTFRRLQESLDQAHAYVQDVVVRRPPVWPVLAALGTRGTPAYAAGLEAEACVGGAEGFLGLGHHGT